MKRVLLETVLVALVGGSIAFLANAVSPRGLSLARNYFPGGTNNTVATPLISARSQPGSTNGPAAVDAIAARAKEYGFTLLTREQTIERFRNPLIAQNLILFIDARDEAHYLKGHIPGSHEFDHYRPEKHLGTVLPLCQLAEQVVIYCNGGDCEDSLFAAMSLRDAGIEPQKLFIYTGGMQDWATNNLPIELGPKDSGQLKNSSP
jgi:rhodanese-related sulfurtransferase